MKHLYELNILFRMHTTFTCFLSFMHYYGQGRNSRMTAFPFQLTRSTHFLKSDLDGWCLSTLDFTTVTYDACSYQYCISFTNCFLFHLSLITVIAHLTATVLKDIPRYDTCLKSRSLGRSIPFKIGTLWLWRDDEPFYIIPFHQIHPKRVSFVL